MLPNPVKVLQRVHTPRTDSCTVRHQLNISPLLTTSYPVYCNDRRVTVEDRIISIVRGNFSRARCILSQPQQNFDVEIALLDMPELDAFMLDLGYLCDTLTPAKTHQALDLQDEELGVIIEQHGASQRDNSPSIVRIGFTRHQLVDE